ncbi:PepSY-like domain-containing protein [Tellurirhabdus bombi]|uniref:PepSY-like domain-containing protein n=1 Tax=Tellurirhabdus bombi TaxID=2907205 RepID=UPI001F46A98D|nr:PepSY-like domain-containing protein [Tellurirhabdus bombi]
MKKTFAILSAFTFLAMSSCDSDKVVPESSLPQGAVTFISTHFPQEKILQVSKERDGLKNSFDVILSNGFDLDFTDAGECTQVDGKNTAIPDAVVTPAKILTYTKANFAQQSIFSWEKDRDGNAEYEIELSNGLDLKFDKNGDFLRIDN